MRQAAPRFNAEVFYAILVVAISAVGTAAAAMVLDCRVADVVAIAMKPLL
jgi:hypothetical protein